MIDDLRHEINDARVLDAMAELPRERFVAATARAYAYDDRALAIGAGQTISQPLIVAVMTEALELRAADKVLDVGTGSGYQAAVLAKLAREVHSVERIESLLEAARRVLADLHIDNVSLHRAGDRLGRPEDAPYDAVLVAAGAPHIPRTLLEQLAEGGRLVMPVGDRRAQQLVRATKTPHGLELARLGPCAFVPLIGDDGWPDPHAQDGGRRGTRV